MKNGITGTEFLNQEGLREHVKHIYKLNKVRSVVDTKPPRSFSHLKSNPKKKLRIQIRNEEITVQNKILFEKLLKIDNKTTQRPSGFIPKTARYTKVQFSKQIFKENLKFLQRIKSAKAFYPISIFNKSYEHHAYLKAQLRENSGRVPKITNFLPQN